MSGLLRASRRWKPLVEVAARSTAVVHNASCRQTQTHAGSDWNHPWTRDQLAKRMRILKERRLDKYLLWNKFATLRRSSYLETPSPVGVEQVTISSLLGRPDLIVTRNIEWANLLIGFEQENRYVIMDPRESLSVVGFIIESSNFLMRQLLRTRRPFTASIMDAAENVLFTVKRPAWFINSTIYAEIDGKNNKLGRHLSQVIGFAKRRWHLWRRIYDLYLGKRQFAVVENPGFWYWTFTLKDESGRVLAEIDRHFRGFGYEMLTDAGQYALRFGGSFQHSSPEHACHPSALHGINVNPELQAEEFRSERPLSLLERTVTLALAISLDNDYFSRRRGFFLPLPFVSDGE